MKKTLVILLLIVGIFCLTGCNNNEKKETKNKGSEEYVKANFLNVEANNDGNIIIDTTNITSTATFVNYKVDNVTIQFVVVKGTDGVVRIAFNTCQSCNPSPNAYFVQKGEYLECQNCGNRFHIDEIGEAKGGCNPHPVEEKEISENKIILTKDYVDTFKEKFENFNGPTE